MELSQKLLNPTVILFQTDDCICSSVDNICSMFDSIQEWISLGKFSRTFSTAMRTLFSIQSLLEQDLTEDERKYVQYDAIVAFASR